eukprot:Clim_evm14s6 gene=Clim_evmTU14s6
MPETASEQLESGKITTNKIKFIKDKVLPALNKYPPAHWFKKPVDPKALPQYYDFIKNPMDFATVRKKIMDYSYQRADDVTKDLELIFDNARRFNPAGTQPHEDANHTQKKLEELLKDMPGEEYDINMAKPAKAPAPKSTANPAREVQALNGYNAALPVGGTAEAGGGPLSRSNSFGNVARDLPSRQRKKPQQFDPSKEVKQKHRPKPNTPLSRELQWCLKNIVREFLKPKHSEYVWPFIDPVDLNLVPNYRELVEKPICLKDIEEKLEYREYRDPLDFESDMRQIFENCRVYNSRENPIHTQLMRFQEEFEWMWVKRDWYDEDFRKNYVRKDDVAAMKASEGGVEQPVEEEEEEDEEDRQKTKLMKDLEDQMKRMQQSFMEQIHGLQSSKKSTQARKRRPSQATRQPSQPTRRQSAVQRSTAEEPEAKRQRRNSAGNTPRYQPEQSASSSAADPIRDLTEEEKTQLHTDISNMDENGMQAVVDIVSKRLNLDSTADELEIDLYSLDAATLRKLQEEVKSWKRRTAPAAQGYEQRNQQRRSGGLDDSDSDRKAGLSSSDSEDDQRNAPQHQTPHTISDRAAQPAAAPAPAPAAEPAAQPAPVASTVTAPAPGAAAPAEQQGEAMDSDDDMEAVPAAPAPAVQPPAAPQAVAPARPQQLGLELSEDSDVDDDTPAPKPSSTSEAVARDMAQQSASGDASKSNEQNGNTEQAKPVDPAEKERQEVEEKRRKLEEARKREQAELEARREEERRKRAQLEQAETESNENAKPGGLESFDD